MRTGRVLRFDDVRGYGFIAPDGGGEDVFVHVNELVSGRETFVTGASVTFEVTEGERGLKAYAVRVVDGDARPAPAGPGNGSPAARAAGDDEDMCDLLSYAECSHELTEILLTAVPTLTGEQIVQLRQRLLRFAQDHGWASDQ
ncbi:MAG: cold-shock protein [Streptosporangiaceae bacterium]